MFPVHQTPPEACQVADATGWVRLTLPKGGGVVEVTRLPLVDVRDGMPTFARPTYRSARVVAARYAAHLMTTGLVNLICEEGHYIDPIIVRETPAEKAERLQRGGTNPLERMATKEWAARHDDAVMAALSASNWTGWPPVSNAGKDWIEGAKPGRALNYGWDTDERPEVTSMIQTLGTKHDDMHTDYSQTLRLVRAIDPDDDGILDRIMNLAPNLRTVARALGVALEDLAA